MKHVLQVYSKSVQILSTACAALAALFSLLLVLITFEQVGARYFFNASSIAIQELQWHLFAITFLLASPYALIQGDHVRVDIFYHRFPPHWQRYINAFGTIFFLIPSMGLLIYFGWDYVLQARSYTSIVHTDIAIIDWLFAGEGSANPGGLPGRALLKFLIPFCGILSVMQAIDLYLLGGSNRG